MRRRKPIEQHLGDLMALPGAPIKNKVWLEMASQLVGELHAFRLSFQRLHRRCQRAEKDAVREGRRADRFARLTRSGV